MQCVLTTEIDWLGRFFFLVHEQNPKKKIMSTSDRVRSAYDATAEVAAAGGLEDCADDVETVVLRGAIAFVKSSLLDAAVRCSVVPGRGFSMADVACGRGQDIPKLFHALRNSGKECSHVTCIDISSVALECAADKALKFLRPHFPRLRLQFCVEDVASPIGPCSWATGEDPHPHGDVHEKPGGGQRHLLFCHLALHYWCDLEARVQAFFRKMAVAAAEDALLVLSFADGRWVVRAGREALARQQAAVCRAATSDRPGLDSVVKVQYGPVQISIGADLLGALPSPFGAKYEFSLGQGARVDCDEYLVHEGALCGEAAKMGWKHVALSMRADELGKVLFAKARYQAIASKMRVHSFDMDTPGAALYRFVVLAKSPEAAREFNVALRQ